MREVRQFAGTITANPHLARAFKGGVPNVSVFWVEHDVPLKAIVDLKRFANQRERPVDLAILLTIAEYRYDVQARHYLSAARGGGYPCKPHAEAGQLLEVGVCAESWDLHRALA